MGTINVHAILSHRFLVWTFAVVDLKLRYKNSVLGFFWSVLEPLLMLAVLYSVFTFVFPSKIVDYPLYLLLGIIIWNFFVRGTITGMNSINARGGLVVTVYFPRIILPISAVTTSFLMMCMELGIFVLFAILFHMPTSFSVLLLPLFLFFLYVLNVGLALPLSILNVRFKDIGYIWQVLTYAGFFLTPIIYNLGIFPDSTQNILLLNPVTQIVNMSHESVLYGTIPKMQDIVYTGIISFVVLLLGVLIFQKKEKNVSDYL